MARLGRYFLPDQQQHLIQRGNNRGTVFFSDGKRDILWRSTSGEVIDWTMNGPVIAASVDTTIKGGRVRPDATFNVVGVGDFNGDGAQVQIGRSRGPQGGEPAFGVLAQGLDDVPALLFGGRYE
jgi:hypothetical protein